MLFPAVPPSVLLPSGTFQVDVNKQSTGPARLEVAEGTPDSQVVATLTEWTVSRRRGTR